MMNKNVFQKRKKCQTVVNSDVKTHKIGRPSKISVLVANGVGN